MRNKWLLLGLTTLASSGFAGDDCCDPCGDCCVPGPDPRINCVAFTAPFYDMQCDWGLFVDGEFLYWYGKETGLDYAVEYAAVSDSSDSDPLAFSLYVNKAKSIQASWDPGFRVGIGFSSSCDGWDYYLHWTSYTNKKSNSTSVPAFAGGLPSPGEKGLLTPWIGLNTTDIVMYERIHGKWRFHFNQVDLEQGRRYWLSPCFTLRPYVALRGIWTDTTFQVTGSPKGREINGMTSMGLSAVQPLDRFKNRFWGVGFLGGLQPTWHFSDCVSLYGNMDVALLWGERDMKNRTFLSIESGEGEVVINIDHYSRTSKFFGMQAILDTGIGLRWESCFCDNRFRFLLDTGWEHHILFNHNKRFKLSDFDNSQDIEGSSGRAPAAYFETRHDVSFGGFVLRVRFDF